MKKTEIEMAKFIYLNYCEWWFYVNHLISITEGEVKEFWINVKKEVAKL
jgi:hypothetical protein